MKFFISAKSTKREEAKILQEFFIKNGHQLSHDWTLHKNTRPFEEHTELAKEYADLDFKAISESDFFIIINEMSDTSPGASAEFGMACALFKATGKPKIYVIAREELKNMFYLMPFVKRMKNVQEIADDLHNYS